MGITMSKILNTIKEVYDWLSANKTFTTVGIAIGLAAYQGISGHQVPEWIYMILGFSGLGFHRSAINTQTQDLVQAIVTQRRIMQETPTK